MRSFYYAHNERTSDHCALIGDYQSVKTILLQPFSFPLTPNYAPFNKDNESYIPTLCSTLTAFIQGDVVKSEDSLSLSLFKIFIQGSNIYGIKNTFIL